MAIEGLKAKVPSKGEFTSGGHEAEPMQPHGPRVKGKHPPAHSHTSHPKNARKLGVPHKIFGMKRAMRKNPGV
jgi:hypothetical protein